MPVEKAVQNGPWLYARGKNSILKTKQNQSSNSFSNAAQVCLPVAAVKHTEDKTPVQSTSVCPPLF